MGLSPEAKAASRAVANYNGRLLDTFHEMGYHCGLLASLRGRTAEAEWKSLERLLMTPPDELDLDDVFVGTRWRKFPLFRDV